MPRRTVHSISRHAEDFNARGSLAIHTRESLVVVAASDAPDEIKYGADFVCDGVNDDEEIQDAIKVLPPSGGKIKFSVGTFTLGVNVVLPTNKSNIIIEGSGKGTLFNCNGVLAIFLQGNSPCATFRELSTDAGGISVNLSLEGRAEYWKDGVWTSTLSTIVTPQVWMKWFDHSALTDIELGTLPARGVITGVRIYVEEAFNAADTNLISIGGMWGAVVELDAYTLDADVGSIGDKPLFIGARFGSPSIVKNLTWITYTGTTPAAGRVLVTVFFEVAPTRPT